MKPDGDDTATMEPMEALNAGPAIEVAPVGEAQDQALPSMQTEGEPQTTEALSATNKTGKDKPANSKAMAKAPVKTKAPTTGTKVSTTSSRPTTGQSRLTNGTQKPQTNGVTKKTTTGGLEKKSTSTTAASKKTTVTAPTTKVAEKKPMGTARPPSASTNGVKTTGTAQPIKKAPTAPANGLKSKPKTTAPAPRPASASTTKPSTTDSPKPVSKTTRPAGSASTARSSPATPKLAIPTTAGKTSTSASRPTTATPKTPTTTAKPSPAKTTAPPAGRTPTQTPKTTTPVKKDASKQSSTPAAKKPSASPLTRPAAAKTTKPDTPKSATTAKPELSSKKPTTPSKTADPKTSKPKESKATPSKEVSASHKTTGSKTSTKTSSPKKAVGSSTPMPVKRGPKATQPADAAATEGEKDDVATTVAVAAAATVAATAAAAVATMVTSEETHEGSATPVLSAASEGSHEDLHTPDIPAASEVKFEDSFTSHSPPASMERFEETVQPVISPAFEDASEDKVLPVIPPTFDEIPNETLTPVIPPLSEDAIEDTDTPVILPTFNQAPEESVTSVIPSAFDKAVEDKVIPDIPPASEEVSEDKVIPVIPPASEEVPEDKVAPVIHPTFEEAPEEMVTPVISPTSEEVELVYPQDPQSMDFYKDDNAMSQLAAQVDLVSLEEPVPTVSPLGTTVLSPPSSPTGPVSMPETLQSSAPFLGLQGPAEPWAQSTSLFPSTATPEIHEQDEETVLDDIQRSSSTAEKLMGDFDLLSSTSADHFRSIAPVSTCQEREEAVEKAEEEINEDIHDDDEEEEEEDDEEEEEEKDEVREIAIEQAMPHKELEDDFTKGVADFGSSDWGMTLSDDMHSGYKLDEVVTSPFNAEKTCSAKGDFFMSEAEREQPFIGPPGIESFSEEEDEEEDEDKEEEHQKEDMDVDSEHGEHHTQQKEVEKEENVEKFSGGMAENELDVCVNDDDVVDDDDDDVGGEGYTEEGHLGLHYMSQTAPTQSMTMTETWSHSSPFSDPWAQPASILSESSLLDMRAADSDTHTNLSTDPDTTTKFSAEPDTHPKSPSGSFLEISPPLIQASEPQHGISEETESSVPAESGILVAPAIAMSQSSTLSGTALAAHSSSETSTPEELQDYDSSSGVESRSDKLQTPVPTMQTDMEQDLGIHLERGDGEEEEAETLPADEVLGDAATAPASVPSSPSTSGDEASDTEGEMLINDPDIAADESTTVSHNLAALEEDEEAPEHIGEEDGDTPHSANSVASYGFDCSASNSNAHSTAESCGKSPGIFSLENEEQLPEEAKDPFFIKELTLPAASAYSDDLLGCPVDLLPVSEPKESNAGFDEHYMLCRKTDPSAMEEVDPESPMHLSPQHGDDSDGQPPYYSAICDKTDNFLAGNV